MNLVYKYIILGCGLGEYYDYAYKQVNEIDGNLYDGKFPWNKFWKLVNRIHFSNKLNNYIQLPFKRLWVIAYLKHLKKKVRNIAKQEEKICFVFFRTWFIVGLLKYDFETLLRKEYPNCKIVFYIQDQVRVSGIPQEIMIQASDLVLYYDKVDAENFGGVQYDVPYSNISEFIVNKNVCSDVYFCGNAKDRYNDIIKVFEIFSKRGYVCDFNIMGVPKRERLYRDKINYTNKLSYRENLERASQSRCLLEIVQKASTGNTLRVYEAIMLDKILISNNKKFKENSLFNDRYMCVFEDASEIDTNFLKMKDVKYEYKNKLYPINLMSFIDKQLVCSVK